MPSLNASACACALSLLVGADACALDATPSREGIEVVLLGRDLGPRTVTLVGFEDGAPVVARPDGTERTVPTDELAALVQATWLPELDDGVMRRMISASSGTRLELTTGEQLVGSLRPETLEDGRCVLANPQLGLLGISLDELRHLTVKGGVPGAPEPSATVDRVVLANGDILEGFIDSIGENVVIETDSGVTEVPIKSVGELSLANQPTELTGPVVWLADGTVIGLESIEQSADARSLPLRLTARQGLRTDDEPSHTTARAVRGLMFDFERVTPVSRLEVVETLAAPGRTFTDPIVLDPDDEVALWAGTIRMSGPMSVEWMLPDGAAGLAGWIRLDERAAPWGDCIARVEVVTQGAPRVIASERVSVEGGRVRIHTPLADVEPGSRLRLTIEAGRYGPVRDWVVLERWLIWRDTPGEGS